MQKLLRIWRFAAKARPSATAPKNHKLLSIRRFIARWRWPAGAAQAPLLRHPGPPTLGGLNNCAGRLAVTLERRARLLRALQIDPCCARRTSSSRRPRLSLFLNWRFVVTIAFATRKVGVFSRVRESYLRIKI